MHPIGERAGAMARGVLSGFMALLVCTALVFPYVGGAVTAYALIFLSLPLIAWSLSRSSEEPFDAGSWLFVISWSLICIAFALTNKPGRTDLLLGLNFVMFAMYPLLTTALQRFADPRNTTRVAILSLIGAFVALLAATLQTVAFNYERAEGFGSNPIASSTIALFLGFFSLVGLFSVRDARRYFFLLGPAAGTATVFLSQSRGPLLALPALLLIALVMVPLRRVVIASVLAAGLLLGSSMLLLKPDLVSRISALPQIAFALLSGEGIDEETDGSASVRYRILIGSIDAFAASPWIGYGWTDKAAVVQGFVSEPIHFQEARFAHLHSDLLNFAVSGGLIGIVAYILALMAPIASAMSSPRDSQYASRLFLSLTLSTGYLLCGVVNMLLGFEFLTTMYVCLASIFIGWCREPGHRPAS